MKKLFLALFLITTLLLRTGVGQCINDINFRTAISNVCPTCIDNGGCLLPDAKNLTTLDVSGKSIADISGVYGFTGLQSFYCSNNNITTVPTLPDSLLIFFCSNNQITSLPVNLPFKLQQLKCENNLLTSLPSLPNSLLSLFCSDNLLGDLPPLPNNLDNLTCNDNHIYNLPPLPSHLTSIHANLNLLYELPELPNGIKKIYCEQNQLYSLPALPATLNTLEISGNPIACLPELPYNISVIGIDFTNITCLPNLPAIYQVVSPLPLCVAGQPNDCALHPTISGNVYVDYNGDGIKDADDIGFPGIAVKSNSGNWASYSDAAGNYKVSGDFNGTHSYSVVLPPGNYSVNPSAPYNLTFDDTSGQKVSNIDFAIHPAPDVYDLGISVAPGQAVSSIKTNFYLTYTNKGPFAINGSLQFQHDNKITFISADITPFLQSGNTLTWAINALQPFETVTVTAKFDIPSTVLAGTKLAYSAIGNISGATDIYPNDNSISDSVTVTGVASSNYKTVNRTQIIPSDLPSGNEELEYTIFYQNIGATLSQNIDIYDTLSTNINTASFAMLGANHPGVLQTTNATNHPDHPLVLHWNFDNIKLQYAGSDQLSSRGFVKFKVKPLTTLSQGDKILNKSIIQFSNIGNPVITNTVTTNITFPVSVLEMENGTAQLLATPNPFNNSIGVKYELLHAESIELYLTDIYGSVVWSQNVPAQQEATLTIDLARLAPGTYLLGLKGDHSMAHARIIKM